MIGQERTRMMSLAVALGGAAVLVIGCSREEPPQAIRDTGMVEYVDDGTALPRIRYADDQVSLNDRCPVKKGKLNRKLPPLYVNGRPVGFC